MNISLKTAIRSIVSLLIFSVASTLFSQEILTIKKKDNTTLNIPTSDIVSLTFSGSKQIIDDNSIVDVDGNVYNTVKIGMQTWTGRNLETTKFKNGDPIPIAGSEAEWANAAKTGKPAWCYYLDDSENGIKYGKLYNWYAVNDKRGLAPEGWRVSSASDWDEIKKFLKNIPGAKLKEKGNANWVKNTNNVTNETGFTALPGGVRTDNGKFSGLGSVGVWWTSDIIGLRIAIWDYNSSVQQMKQNKGYGYSVRLVKE
ncbi:MAG: fibrobacter succinogenes major paralogous domain-containing protein [Candidatus Delongbacteria bacterium]|nr:fibrobacter succinogenes major paralogous domain-containing protein [Candidatus Delongbacteria bacterium]